MVEPHHYLEITELAELIAARDISPAEATRTQLDRIVALMASCIAMPSLHPSSGRPRRTLRKPRSRSTDSAGRRTACRLASRSYSGPRTPQRLQAWRPIVPSARTPTEHRTVRF